MYYPTIIATILSLVWVAGRVSRSQSPPTVMCSPAQRQHRSLRYLSRIYDAAHLSKYGTNPSCSIVFSALIGCPNHAEVAHDKMSTLVAVAAKRFNS